MNTEKTTHVKSIRKVISLVAIIVVVVGIGLIINEFTGHRLTETTEDASIEQYVYPVNCRIPGYVKKICFTEHQLVRKGDTLLVLDDREYLINVKQAEAVLADAQAGKDVLETTLITTQTNVGVFDDALAEIDTRIAKMERDYNRFRTLYDKKAATEVQLENLKVELDALRLKKAQTLQQQKAGESGINEVRKRQGNTKAGCQRAEAALESARLNLSYTVVLAPCDGIVGRRSLEEGQFIGGQTTVTYITPSTQKWIIANYKETQIAHLRIGQKVSIKVDAFDTKEYVGEITAISGATGNKYSLVPADNSTGNFVKIQQRIPVRIDFKDLSKEDNNRFVAGMMAEVSAILE